MKNLLKTMALGTVALAAMSGASYAAERPGAFTSHHEVGAKPYQKLADKLPADEKLELREYLNYEQREPCQFYQPIPQGFMIDGCRIVPVQPKAIAVRMEVPQEETRISNVLNDYEVHFAFDSANIEPAAGDTLDEVADEIQKYKPREVTVSGYTDTAGPSDYNVGLSEERASAVSKALTERGVANRVIEKEAYGETQPAVDTKDGVALQENRRVVVEFRK